MEGNYCGKDLHPLLCVQELLWEAHKQEWSSSPAVCPSKLFTIQVLAWCLLVIVVELSSSSINVSSPLSLRA